jgi:hypothetical protein
MFEGCRSLTQAPELPATTLAEGCYDSMFINCKLPFTFTNKTFEEMVDVIQNYYILGYDCWYDEDGNPINPVEIICSDKTMLATLDENNYEWILTEK